MRNITLACFLINVVILLWSLQVGAGWGSILLSAVCAGICLHAYLK
jgi:hypothetical protein